jgi:LAO/AO transport system kinase
VNVSASLLTGVLEREPRALARALSVVSDDPVAGSALLSGIQGRTGRAFLVGVTGPPGAGKSTLVDRLIREVRGTGRTVGVLAVDPTSPFSGGALLGDRVRMQAHASDAGVFIRSLATRGQLGGLSSATAGAADVLDAAGFDVVFIETVGVGQDELDIARLADVRIVVFVPDQGDEVQDMKAGLMEIGDIFVVNKSDRAGADRTVGSLEGALRLSAVPDDAWVPPVVATVATDGTGVGAVVEAIDRFRSEMATRVAERRRARSSGRAIAAGGTDRARIDHIGIAVSDAAPILSFLSQTFGAGAEPAIDAASHGVRVQFVHLGGSSIEVLEALGAESPIATFLARRGPGLHHIAVEVEDLEAAIADLRRRGVRLVDDTPRPGADGRAIAFIHPSATGGVLVELISREPTYVANR